MLLALSTLGTSVITGVASAVVSGAVTYAVVSSRDDLGHSSRSTSSKNDKQEQEVQNASETANAVQNNQAVHEVQNDDQVVPINSESINNMIDATQKLSDALHVRV